MSDFFLSLRFPEKSSKWTNTLSKFQLSVACGFCNLFSKSVDFIGFYFPHMKYGKFFILEKLQKMQIIKFYTI
jgi:hypothetical protein